VLEIVLVGSEYAKISTEYALKIPQNIDGLCRTLCTL